MDLLISLGSTSPHLHPNPKPSEGGRLTERESGYPSGRKIFKGNFFLEL